MEALFRVSTVCEMFVKYFLKNLQTSQNSLQRFTDLL